MKSIPPLGLNANQWRFLNDADKYVDASGDGARKLALQSTRRQFLTARDILARLNGSQGEAPRRGVLLADDVGLGKTTVAALVAWVVASAGPGRNVRILAPNDVMVRRWAEELKRHVVPLQQCAPALGVKDSRVKAGRVARLAAGSIQVVKHSYAAADDRLVCDLLIVDEAHRAKGKGTAFSAALKRRKKEAGRVLILTATPFSLRLDELKRMLELVGGEQANRAIRAFSDALDDLYTGDASRSPERVADALAAKAKAASVAMSPFVIRHGVDDLGIERRVFGEREDWPIEVAPARPEEMELLVRMDRARRLKPSNGSEESKAFNDSRFHVGWRHFDAERLAQEGRISNFPQPAKSIVEGQLKAIKRLRSAVSVHPKLAAVGSSVRLAVEKGEKVLLFCHHHATAQELTIHLDSVLPKAVLPRSPVPVAWLAAWRGILKQPDDDEAKERLREPFIAWLCADLVRSQSSAWIKAGPSSQTGLTEAIQTTTCRFCLGQESMAEAARLLFEGLLRSRSSHAVLQEAANRRQPLLGASGVSRVLGVCEGTGNQAEDSLFIDHQQPDTIIEIFNSPFGPDVLVVTDKLSEGIDLHRYCRHLIHYELDPSPVRTVQRNGRLRRVNSWAATTGEPIRYAYPAFAGTRDERLVEIMKKRIDSFSLLLGGVHDIKTDAIDGKLEEERWRNKVIELAKSRLASAGNLLKAMERGAGRRRRS